MNTYRSTKLGKRLSHLFCSLFILTLTFGWSEPIGASPGKATDDKEYHNQIQDVPGLLFYDNFDDGNADGWTTSGVGTWYVDNNEYVIDMDGFWGYEGLSVAGDADWTNYVLDIDMMGEQMYDKLINFRYHDVDTRYEVNMRSSFDDISVGRVFYDIGIGEYFHNVNNTWYHVTIFSIDERILVLVDGVLELDWFADSENYITHGKIGLRGWNGAKVRYDNVLVQKIIAISGPTIGVDHTDYTFLATSVPISPTEPITYTWQSTDYPIVTHVGGITDTITYNWDTPGIKVITTTATTSYGTITETFHNINLTLSRRIFLPLLIR